jgi:8-oxo-dGTP pyrophosphatase MutT (NUDIX family)
MAANDGHSNSSVGQCPLIFAGRVTRLPVRCHTLTVPCPDEHGNEKPDGSNAPFPAAAPRDTLADRTVLLAVLFRCRRVTDQHPMPIRVLASVIQHEDRLLICQRPLHKRHGGLWEVPGGKVKEGETDLEAARRELGEELGIGVTEVGPVELSVADPGSDFVIEFLAVAVEGEPQALEHMALEWMREEELLALPLAPGDRRYVLFRMDGGGGSRGSPPRSTRGGDAARGKDQPSCGRVERRR